jgi:hypothetical protein
MIIPIKPEDMIPAKEKTGKNLRDLIEFMNTGEKYGRVELGDQTLSSKASCLRTAIRRSSLPLKQVQRKNELYIIRTDM